jgi:GT2 family glycosyltransferase
MKIGFVFTNYNNSQYTRDVIYSLSLNEYFNNCFLVIVDNKSDFLDINKLNEIEQIYPSVKVIYNNENIGYFKGLNIGIEYLRSKYSELNCIVVGNNDLFFPQNFIDRIYLKNELFKKYPVISPDLVTLDGIHQNPHVINRISWFRNLIYDLYYTNYYLSILIGFLAKITKKITDRNDEKHFEIAQTIHQGYGACYILGPIFFQKFKSLWAPTFLMGEEFFLSKQLEKEGMHVYYEPSIKVDHHDHATMGKLPNKKLWKISRDSHLVYKKYLKE